MNIYGIIDIRHIHYIPTKINQKFYSVFNSICLPCLSYTKYTAT